MAGLELIALIQSDQSSTIDNRGSATFKSEAYKSSGGTRILVWQVYADWVPAGLNGVAESSTPTLPKNGSSVKVWFRNGTHDSGTPYSQTWKAWVASKGAWETPISNVLEGTF